MMRLSALCILYAYYFDLTFGCIILKAGNRRFRDAIDNSIENYIRATNKIERAVVVQAVIDEINSTGGKFVRKDFHRNRVSSLFAFYT